LNLYDKYLVIFAINLKKYTKQAPLTLKSHMVELYFYISLLSISESRKKTNFILCSHTSLKVGAEIKQAEIELCRTRVASQVAVLPIISGTSRKGWWVSFPHPQSSVSGCEFLILRRRNTLHTIY